jgi:colicin import membrane protein
LNGFRDKGQTVSSPQRFFSWVLSLALHILVLVGGTHFAVGTHIKIDPNKRMYEVSLVGAPNKGKPGARTAARPGTPPPQEARQKPPAKAAPEVQEIPEQKKPEKKAAPQKPEKKAVPPDTAKPIPKETVNATKVAEAKPEEKPKPEAKKKEEKPKAEAKKEEKKPEPKKEEPKKAPKKAPSKEEILAQALADAGKAVKTADRSGASTKTSKGSSSDPLADALADLGREVSGRGTRGDGRAEDGEGTGESSGSLADYYATQVVRVVRPNWRYPGRSAVELTAGVELKINRAGEILAARIISSSGRSDYDASIMRGIEETRQLPPLPAGLPTTLIIHFSSNEMR